MRRFSQRPSDEPDKISWGRVCAISVTLVLHLVGFGMLLLPASNTPDESREVVTTVRFVEPVVIPPPPPPPPPPPEEPKPVVTKPVTKTPPKPAPPKPRATTPTPAPVMATEVETATSTNVVQGPPADPGPPTPTPGPSSAEPTINDAVVVLSGPHPKYPVDALRAQVQGEVILIVDIDATGKATAVRVERSSGNRSLDREARSTVLRSWRFQSTGSPQRARLPIRFSLE